MTSKFNQNAHVDVLSKMETKINSIKIIIPQLVRIKAYKN